MSKGVKPYQFINFEESEQVIKNEEDPLLKFKIEKKFVPEFDFKKDEEFKSLFSANGELTKEDYQKSVESYYDRKRKDAEKEILNYIKEKKKEAEKIIEDAKKEYEKIRNEAYNKGFEEGFKKGFDEGKEELNKKLNELKELVTRLNNFEEEIIKSNKEKVSELIIKFAKKIIKKELEVYKDDILLENLKIVLEKIVDKGYLKIKINYSQFDFLYSRIEELKEMFNLEKVEIEKSKELNPGDCIIETNFGNYDLRINEQIGELDKALKNNG